MGGDHGISVTVPAALRAVDQNPNLHLLLVGDEIKLGDTVSAQGGSRDGRVSIHHASQIVEMSESPAVALRKKKDSSMRVAINLVKSGEADACVSAGNTGALMATSRFVLKMLPGIDRPAICTALPTMTGTSYMLDLGADVDAPPESLFQYAVMGSELATAVNGTKNPTIGLLNIGEEEIKGNEVVKQAAELLSQADAENHIHYHGFIEGDDIYKGTVDVVVCDGFVGNVALKVTEGVVEMISHSIKASFHKNFFSKLAGLIAAPALRSFKKRFDPRLYNGASLLGLRGIVVKSHGGTDVIGFQNAIQVAAKEVEHAVPEKIEKHLHRTLVGEQS